MQLYAYGQVTMVILFLFSSEVKGDDASTLSTADTPDGSHLKFKSVARCTLYILLNGRKPLQQKDHFIAGGSERHL
jgi:hypothetical protein